MKTLSILIDNSGFARHSETDSETELHFSPRGFQCRRPGFVLRLCACLSNPGRLVEFGQAAWLGVYPRLHESGRPVLQYYSPQPPSAGSTAPPEQICPCNVASVFSNLIFTHYSDLRLIILHNCPDSRPIESRHTSMLWSCSVWLNSIAIIIIIIIQIFAMSD